MGGAVSSGNDNNELVDNLMNGRYIRTKQVEEVFRALDRADYMTTEYRDNAYKDLAWRSGPLHISSPCIYSEVMEGLELRSGLSFLNVGSGTGYLSTMAGLILGSTGISHGVEIHPEVYDYAVMVMGEFMERSDILDEFDFCQPKYYNGNGLCIAPLQTGYDRVYCGAGCPTQYEAYFRNLIKVGGILVMPLNDTLVQVRRVSKTKWVTRSLLSVTFAPLQIPASKNTETVVKLDELTPVRLDVRARACLRAALRAGLLQRAPALRREHRAPPPRAVRPTRMRIPVEPAAAGGFNILHDLNPENGANEMNALLNLVISMGHSRVAGALRFDRVDFDSATSEEYDSNTENNDDADAGHESGVDSEESKNLESDDVNEHSDANKTEHEKPCHEETERSQSGSASNELDNKEELETNVLDNVVELNDEDTTKNTVTSRASTSQDVQPEVVRSSKKSKYWKRKSDDSRNRKGRKGSSSSSSSSLPLVPNEVEINFIHGNRSHSDMEEESLETDNQDASDEETECIRSKPKRLKMDSGIGDSAQASPDLTSDSDESVEMKYKKYQSDDHRGGAGRGRGARRKRGAEKARRARLARRMRRAVWELPLPRPLRLFVNLNRTCES